MLFSPKSCYDFPISSVPKGLKKGMEILQLQKNKQQHDEVSNGEVPLHVA